MKRLLFLLLLFNISLFSQTYEKVWNEVKKFEAKSLPKSALTQVQAIYNQAKEEKNELQFIKALLYKERYLFQLTDNSYTQTIKDVEEALTQSPKQSTQLILRSILGEMYMQYLARNYYKIKNRTVIKEDNSIDIETWSVERLLSQSSKLYIDSLDKSTQKISLKNYQFLMYKSKNMEGIFPTLYDFLAFRALKYFKAERYYFHNIFKNFQLKETDAFSPAHNFMHKNFKVQDKNSFKYQALLIYQNLLKLHTKDGQKRALEHVNLERLLFLYQNIHTKRKEKLYIKALNTLIENNAQSEALYYLAQYYLNQEKHIQAFKYASQGVKSSNNYIRYKCQEIKNRIEIKKLKFEIERINLPNENILSKVTYKNSSKVFVKVIKATKNIFINFKKTQYDKKINYLNSLSAFKEFQIDLERIEDYKEHSSEISLGSYEAGRYIFLLSTEENFQKNSIYKLTNISNISYTIKENRKLLVLHRKTGQPLEGLTASFYIPTYSKPLQKEGFILHSSEKSNKQGFITLPKIKNSYFMSLKYKNEQLSYDGRLYSNYHNLEPKNNADTFVNFFTDRAIYRPNQTIYFKGLAIQKNSHKRPKVLRDKKLLVKFYDTNHQLIKEKAFTTDDFGTFNGTFIAPSGGLLGAMRLEANIGGYKLIQVEEYKRPKFEVTFNPLDKEYTLGEKISISGIAKAYAGDVLDGATVQYRVERSANFPWVYSRTYTPYSQEKKITSGTTKTDSKGLFKVDFIASIDKTISKQEQPNYNYTVFVDVTDSTGETHSTSTTVTLGYISINVEISIKSELSVDENHTLTLQTTNLEGTFQPLKGTITVEKLEQNQKIYRKRYWEKIDKQLYTKEEFNKLFKQYKYLDTEKEVKKETIQTTSFDTNISKNILLKGLKEGVYLLTIKTKDKKGIEVSKQQEITVYDKKSQTPVKPSYLWQKSDKDTYKVDTEAILLLKSSIKNLPVLLTIERQGRVTKEKWINIDGLTKELIKVGKRDRGNIHYQLTFVQNNRFYNQTGKLTVPWENQLKVEYLSFRDKLKPNEQEQWRIKISGKNREKVMAQMVATMYDASLDTFRTHNFYLNPLFPNYSFANHLWQGESFSSLSAQGSWRKFQDETILRVFPRLKWLDINLNNRTGYKSRRYAMSMPVAVEAMSPPEIKPLMDLGGARLEKDAERGNKSITKKSSSTPVHIRKNFKETMLFKPNLQTDKEGNIIIDFKTNEALTRWNFLGFVHTKDLKTAITKKTITTAKELMVVSNLPRFFREKDTITLSAKIVNMSEKDLEGECELQLVDPLTEKPIYDKEFKQTFKVKQGASTIVNFSIKIPDINSVSAIKHTLIARTATHSDAEQVIKPILSNRVFITESKVLSVKSNEEKSFTLKSLKENNSTSLKHHKLTVEFTSNPAWYAIQSLPYLMEYEHECSEQLFSRYYANALAENIANSSPKIKAIFDSWRATGQLKSKLSTNNELKAVLKEETPWVLEAQSQEEQQKNIALLFDLHKVASEQKEALEKLKERQLPNGGWSWFGGDRASWYITQYIVEGMGHLQALGVTTKEQKMLNKAINYIDKKIAQEFTMLQKSIGKKHRKLEDDNINSMIIHYLYARSFYKQKMSQKTRIAHIYYLQQAQKYWKDKGLYEQGMITLALHRHHKETKYIVASLKEHALHSNEFGMYFKYTNGYYWNELPIETHALMIEVFETVAKDKKAVEDLKTWLLKQRQTTHWKTTKATSSAIYALLSNSNWLTKSKLVEISFETEKEYQPKLKEAQSKAIKGLGYYKVSYDKNEFDRSMATIKVKNPNKSIAWGSLYWQYFEEMDKVKSFKETPLTIDKKLFLIEQTTKGEQLSPITDQDLKVGDKVKVRIVIKVDRNMEYVMLKDSRASAFEPLNVISQYKYQDGLGYYQSTKDNATYFFIDYLNKGTYVFEYPLVVTHKGEFSNGITSMESMYAPEFKSHSEGIRVKIN